MTYNESLAKYKSNEKAMNWGNQKANHALETKISTLSFKGFLNSFLVLYASVKSFGNHYVQNCNRNPNAFISYTDV